MSKISESADALLQYAEKHRSILDVANELKKIGSIENATEERQKALTEATSAHEAKKAALADAQQRLAATDETIKGTLDAAQTQAEAIIAASRAEAERLTGMATQAAKDVAEAATAQVGRIKSDHEMAMHGTLIELTRLRQDVTDAELRLRDINAEYDSVAEKIATMKAAAQKALG